MSKVLYNVTINVEESILDDWYEWLLEDYLKTIMDTKLFESYRISKLVHPKQDQGVTFSIQLLAESKIALSNYLNNHAPKMDQAHHSKFGDQCVQFSTIMELMIEE